MADSVLAVDRGRPRWGLFGLLATAIVLADQATKAWLTSFVEPGAIVTVAGDWFRLVHGRNSGALFGLFRDQAVVFGVISIAVVAVIVTYHGRSGRVTYLSIALGLLLGGALGNLIDRFRLGYVVDWLDFGIGSTRFWTFNVADAAVSTAIVMMIVMALFPGIVARLGVRADG